MDHSLQPLSMDSIVVVAPSQISSDLVGQQIILNIQSGVYYGLDRVGARIWNFLQQPRRVSEIRDMLIAGYDVDQERAEQDLIALLRKLTDAGLVEAQNESPT